MLERLHEVGTQRDKAGNRQLFMDQYCMLVLLFLFNPIVDSLRGIQQASELARVQKKLGCPRACLGSLSEATDVFDPQRLQAIVEELGGQSLTLDATANGAGWWVDSTPWDHRDYLSAAPTQMDLLTAVSHEIGHLLGYVHSDNPLDVMAGTLSVGTRRLPGLGDLGRGGGWVRQVDRTDQSDQTDRTDLSDQSDRTDQSDLVDPLPIGNERHSGASDAVQRARLRVQALDESTQLLADDLLDLLARIDRRDSAAA